MNFRVKGDLDELADSIACFKTN